MRFSIGGCVEKIVSGLFATHPPMEKRIEQLMRLEGELQRGTLVAA